MTFEVTWDTPLSEFHKAYDPNEADYNLKRIEQLIKFWQVKSEETETILTTLFGLCRQKPNDNRFKFYLADRVTQKNINYSFNVCNSHYRDSDLIINLYDFIHCDERITDLTVRELVQWWGQILTELREWAETILKN